ncbi:MAG: hypothetical protein KBS85_06825, partial [Lachnospiraceae bacterium]|nr:hypothetical protein [Candidatus Merdinaster equi]
MKKKIMACLLVMTVALAGCANNGTAGTDAAVTPEVTQEVAENQETTEPAENVDEAVDAVVDYEAFVGEYQDSNSERASLVVTMNDDSQSVHIAVNYGVSYDITNEWSMDAVFEDNGDGTGKLVYNNCAAISCEYDDEGNEHVNETYTNGSGYFTWGADGSLLWDGASEEDLHDCNFQKFDSDYIDENVDSPAKQLIGGYQDSWSGRASCEITDNSDETVHISVIWGNGATSTCFWEMDASWVDENGKGYLTYDNCAKYYINYADDGTESKEIEYLDGDGFFSVISLDQLTWDGATDDSCKECVFERIG